MLKKLCYLVPIVVLIMMMGTNDARGNPVLRWTGTEDNNFYKPTNWDLGLSPQGGDDAYCQKTAGRPDPNFTSLATTEPICLLCIADSDSNGELNIDSGNLNVMSGLRATKGGSIARTAKVTMKGGTVNVYGKGLVFGTCTGSATDGVFQWGGGYDGNEDVDATWNMQGGLLTTGNFMLPGTGTQGSGTFNLNGGTVIVRNLSTGLGGPTVGSEGFIVNERVNTNRTEPNAFIRSGSPIPGILNISGGTLIAQGNITPLFENRYADAEKTNSMGLYDACSVIVAYPALTPATSYNKYIVYDYDQRNDGRTTLTASAQPIAEAWGPGDKSDPCLFPINGALFADSAAPTLKWNGGAGAVGGHDVYFGTNSASLDLLDNVAAGEPCELPRSSLALGQTYYWKAIAQPSGQAATWTFTVEGKAKGPTPQNGASVEPNATRNVVLRWTGYSGASSHDVYWGTNSALLSQIGNDQTATSKVQQCVLGQVNYWRVDENPKGGGSSVAGNIWSFTVKDYALVDSFEGYFSTVANPNGIQFGDIWQSISGLPIYQAVNSGPDNRKPVHGDKQGLNAHYISGGGNSYALFPETQNWSSASSGAVTLSFWMRGKGNNGIPSSLSIRLSNGSIYSATVDIDNFSSRVVDETWRNVNIPLSSFTDADFNVETVNVGRLHIYSTGTATGDVWIDDIRLYPSRCVPDRIRSADLPTRAGAPLADITNDCAVNGKDLFYITDEWLDSNTSGTANGTLYNCKFDGNSVAGKLGNALQLNGPKDWVDIDDLAFSDFSNKTVAFWVRINDTPMPVTTKQPIFSTSREWRLNVNADNTDFGLVLDASVGNNFEEPKTGTGLIGNAFVAEDTWHHVAVTVSSPTGNSVDCTLFVDGSLQETTTIDAHYYDSLLGACIGGLKNGTSQYSNITIDDFRIYDVALTDTGSPSDIDKLADNDGGTNPSASPLIKYDFEETTGTVAANSGTLSSSTVNHPVGYALGTGGDPTTPGGVSLAELYTGTDGSPAKTYINLKDYARVASQWLYGDPTPWTYP